MIEEKKEKTANENKEGIKKQDKTIRNLLICLGFLVAFFAVWLFISYNQNSLEYNGVKFQKVKEIAPYRTNLVTYTKNAAGATTNTVNNYFYLRNNPKELDTIPFNGNISFRRMLVINSTEDFKCEGFGIIGIANLAGLYQALGVKVIKNASVSCDKNNDYMFLEIDKGNETKIEQIGNSACYLMSVNNCEILPATERFMIQTFVEIEKIRNKK